MARQLEPLAERIVQPAVKPEHLAYCPTMDLIALGTIEEHIQIHRLNGQRVFGVQDKHASAQLRMIKWKPNGQSLATAYSNHHLFLTNTHTGKIIHQIDCSSYSQSQVCCLGWGLNFTESDKVREHIDELKGELSLEDVISRNPQAKPIDDVPDLPLDLAFLDVEASLPKLSPLSFGGIEDDIFNSRASLDTFFQPLVIGSADSADILVVGFEDGTIHLSIYESFVIGSFSLQQASRAFQKCKPLAHCSHPFSTSHALLVAHSVEGGEDLHMVPLDLRLISNAGRYLSLLASKSTQLNNIIRYVHQVQKQMYSDFQASQDLPRKFIGNIEETLRDHTDSNWVQAAYQLVVTGHCHPEVKEWLVDQLGERGHKRWEKATSTGYDSVRRLAHENLLPALERCTVLVSRLRGLSKFEVSNVTLGLSTQELDNVLDILNCLQLVAHRILIVAGAELRQFQAFTTWLRQEIDMQAGDASSSEAGEKDINVDYPNTLEYIQGPMTQSRLFTLFDLIEQSNSSPLLDLNAEGRSLFELYKQEPHRMTKDNHSPKRLPGLGDLIKHLQVQCETVFSRMAETQRRNVRFGGPIRLGAGIPACLDMRTLVEASEPADHFATYVVLGPRIKQTGVRIYRIVVEIENGMSSTRNVEQAFIGTAGWDVKDVKFVDDVEIILAVSKKGKCNRRLLRVLFRKAADHPFGLKYGAAGHREAREETEDFESVGMDLSNLEQLEACTWQEFPSGISWAPERIEINGRKGRRIICVLAQDRLHYRIYDLDSFPLAEEDVRMEGSDNPMS